MLLYAVFLALTLPRIPVQADDRLDAAMTRFQRRLDKLFVQQSRFELVQKGLEEHVQGRTTLEILDLKSVSAASSEKLQRFLDAKVKAVRSLVQTAEEVAETYTYDKKWVPDGVVSKFRTNKLPGQDPERFELECAAYKERIGEANVYNTTEPNDKSKTAVHLNVETFRCDNAVLRDFEWTGTDEMEQIFLKNQNADPSIARQYIGTYSGLTRMLPAIKWKTEPEEVTMDLFDPRYRPWFIGSETAPKDVIFLIDYSGSVKGQTLHLIKITIRHVLMTLTVNDYFTALWYNSKRGFVMEDCCEQRFLAATTRNKRLLLTMLDKIEERDQASLPQALNATFAHFHGKFFDPEEELRQRLGDVDGSGGHKVVLLFTDGIEDWPKAVIEEYNQDSSSENIRVFGFSMGYGTGAMPALDYTSCTTGGSYAIVDSIMDVRLQSKSYFGRLSEVLALSYRDKSLALRPIFWSMPYMDAQRGGAVLSLSLPVLNMMKNSSAGTFVAVAGVDVTFAQLREMLPQHDHLYSFIIDLNGLVYFHPRLRVPKRETYAVRRTACYNVQVMHRPGTRVPYGMTDERVMRMLGLVDSIASMDILDLENGTDEFVRFRRAMIDGNCGKSVQDGTRTYFCTPLKGTPLILGFVQSMSRPVVNMPPPSTGLPATLSYAPRELVGYLIADYTLCPDELGAHSPQERFEPFVFGDYPTCPKAADKHLPFAFVRSVLQWDRAWPRLEENATCLTNALPTDLTARYFISTFVEFFQGITAFYPKCQYKYVQHFTNHRERFRSLEHNANEQQLYIEHEPLSGSITAARPILDTKNKKRLATVGVQWTYSFLSDLWRNNTDKDVDWQQCRDPMRRCLLVTDEAYVVGETGRASVDHLSAMEPILFDQLVNLSIIQKRVYRDYQADCPMENRGKPVMSATSVPRPLSIPRILRSILNWIVGVLSMDLLYLTQDVFARPVVVNGKCSYEKPEHTEQCTLQFNNYHIDISQRVLVHLSSDSECYASVTIVPFKGVELNLFMIDGKCQDSHGTAKNVYSPFRVADCNQSAPLYRRRRSDLDYSRTHVAETVAECMPVSSGTRRQWSFEVLSVVVAVVVSQ